MPQGCCDATAHFVGVMNYVLGSRIGDICVVYVVDIVILAKTQQLVQRARMDLQRLQRITCTRRRRKVSPTLHK